MPATSEESSSRVKFLLEMIATCEAEIGDIEREASYPREEEDAPPDENLPALEVMRDCEIGDSPQNRFFEAEFLSHQLDNSATDPEIRSFLEEIYQTGKEMKSMDEKMKQLKDRKLKLLIKKDEVKSRLMDIPLTQAIPPKPEEELKEKRETLQMINVCFNRLIQASEINWIEDPVLVEAMTMNTEI